MSFLYPLGLLGLIGIPVLIFIYIIKSKYTEQTVASTYLWTLSEKFLKRKRRSSPLTGIISLILQLLAVTLISLLIAHPILTVPGAAKEYCFILDGSGSMRMEVAESESSTATEDGSAQTRFEVAKATIAARIADAVDGSIFTLVFAGDTTGVVYERVEDKEQALLLLDELGPVYRDADLSEAVATAQGYFSENASLHTTLLTDATYETTENIEVVNVAGAEENYAVSEVYHTLAGGKLTVTGKVTSYVSDATLTVELMLDGAETPVATETVEVTGGEPTVFELVAEAVTGYASIAVRIRETDALPEDNAFIIHNVKSENSYNTLIISDRPFFLESALRSQLNATIDVVTPAEYEGQTGYGLYVFDTIDASTMQSLPTDGTVWLVNVAGSVEGAGFTVQGAIELEKPDVLTHATSSASATQKLVEGMMGNEIYVTRYIKCGFYRNFTTLLSYRGNPVVFAGTSEHGNREVVMAFDPHDSNLPLLFDFTVLIRNLVRYSFPDMVDKTTYTVGETADINVIANCDSIRVESPSGEVSYLSTEGASDAIALTEAGIYTVNMTVSGSAREFFLFSAMQEEERIPVVTHDYVGFTGTASDDGFDGQFDPLMILFIALAVVFIADWMVYCYEKYQLR